MASGICGSTSLHYKWMFLCCKGGEKNFKLSGFEHCGFSQQNTAKKIFKLYSRGKPGRVAEIILVSSLSGFSSGQFDEII